MANKIKAIVLRTQKLSATKLFFENDLGLRIKSLAQQITKSNLLQNERIQKTYLLIIPVKVSHHSGAK